jgi:excisionase family DNA binding protein
MSAIKLYSRKEAAELTGLSKGTIYSYARRGKIESKKTPGGHILYDISSLTLVEKKKKVADKMVCYCRVSTYGQKDDLKRQVSYMKTTYPDHEIISDIGSGINFKRKGLRKIIDYALTGQLKQLVVSYKDRLCRIGYELIEYIIMEYSDAEIIIDSHTEETLEEEIANDVLQIINVYSAKINGITSIVLKLMECGHIVLEKPK